MFIIIMFVDNEFIIRNIYKMSIELFSVIEKYFCHTNLENFKLTA